MKLRHLLTVAAMAVGVTSAWGQLYSHDVTDWTSDDLADWNASSAVTQDNENGIGANANMTATYVSKTFEMSEHMNCITYEVEWTFATATGRPVNYNYIDFGSLRIGINSSYNMTVSTDGGATWNETSLGYYYNQTKTAAIKLEIYTETGAVMAFSFDGNDYTELVKDATITNPTTVKTGFIRGGSVGWTLANYIKSISVKESYLQLNAAVYEIWYSYEGEKIGLICLGMGTIGNTVYAKSPVTIDGQKYYAISETSLLLKDALDNELVVEVRKAEEYDYTVKSSLGAVLATGTAIEGEGVSVSYPRYQVLDGVIYEAAKQGSGAWYAKSISVTTNNHEEIIQYNELSNGIVYYSEAEEIAGVTPTTSANANIRCSNCVGGYADTPVEFVTLPAGRYEIHATVWGNTGATITIKAGENTVLETETKGYSFDAVDEFTLTEPATLTFEGANASHPLDLVYIKKLADLVHERTTATDAYGTICLPYVFSVEGAKIYQAELNSAKDYVELTEVETPVAGMPYIYQATADAQKFAYTEGEIVDEAGSLGPLVGVLVDTPATEGTYVLQIQNGVQAFYKAGATVLIKIPAYRAYLSVPASEAKMIGFAGKATAITAINALTSGSAKIYDINGRELKSLQKGVNVVNGVKVLVK